jgi:outer membrane protein assembly factor BamD
MEEAAEAQYKVCMIEYRQMEKPDRDPTHAIEAETECRQLVTQFPNSKFAPEALQRLREIQEALAEGEYRVGSFYHTKGVFYSAANRLQGLTEHFPLYSKADEALWKLGESYGRMGPTFRDRSGEAYARIVRDYPLSPYVDAAKKKLNELEKPIPEPDQVALARQKYELENTEKPGTMSHFWGIFRKSPDVRMAAKSGTPAMESLRPTVPVTVPAAGAAGAPSAEVTAETITGPSALDTQPDARLGRRQPEQPDGAKPEGKQEPKKKK